MSQRRGNADRRNRSSTEKGLGYAHRMRRREALAAFVEGTPCELCGRPMWSQQRLQLDHEVPRVMGGADGPVRLVHGPCNERAGVDLSNARKRARRAGRLPPGTGGSGSVPLPKW